jgi:hypothetical protein
MSRFLIAAAFLLCAGFQALALDWGGSVEDKSVTTLPFAKLGTGSVGQTETARLWVTRKLGPSADFLLKANVADALTYGYAPGPLTNTFTADLESLVISSGSLVVGRTTYKDFGGIVLNTTLDGVQGTLYAPGLDLTLVAGYSGFVFKSGSTVVISQADLTDRIVPEDFTKPSTLFAPPRAVGYVEADFSRLIPNQKLQLAEAVQIDLRNENVAKDGGQHSFFSPGSGTMAPVHMSYTGLGISGRIAGPLYWDFWSYAGLGLSLTPTGNYAQQSVDPSTHVVTPEVMQTWRTSYIVNGIGNIDLTLLLPRWNDTIFNIGLMVGSWDPDGISPDQNLSATLKGDRPSLYTGYFGISRTGSALIFNPQPTNMAIAQVLYSVKPFARSKSDAANFQMTASGFVFLRPTAGAIAETGLDTTSTDLYLASEGDLNLLWRPASDWGASLGVGVLVPGKALTRGIELNVQAGLNLSF